MDQIKIPYVYHDGRRDGGAGKPRHGFYSGVDGKRAAKRIEGILYAGNPGIRHRQEVLYDPREEIAELKNVTSEFSQDEIRKASYATLMQIMQFGTSENARLAAAKELLDRIDGKAVQQVNQNVQGQVQQQVIVQVEYVKARDGREIIDVEPKGGAVLTATGSESDEGV